jgi:hypothetical protein
MPRECDEETCCFIPGRLRADEFVTAIAPRVVFAAEALVLSSPAAGYSHADDIVCRGVLPVPLHVLKQSFLL